MADRVRKVNYCYAKVSARAGQGAAVLAELREAGVSRQAFEAQLPRLIDNALNDSAMVLSLRFPEEEEVEKVYRYVFEGRPVDF